MCCGWGWGGNKRFLIWNVLCQGWGSHVRTGELSCLPGLCDAVQTHGWRALQNLARGDCAHGRGNLSSQLPRWKVTAQQACRETGPRTRGASLRVLQSTTQLSLLVYASGAWLPTLPLCFVSSMFILKVSSGNAFPASWQARNQRRKADSVVIKPSKSYLPSTWDIPLLAMLPLVKATQSPRIIPQVDGQDCELVRF